MKMTYYCIQYSDFEPGRHSLVQPSDIFIKLVRIIRIVPHIIWMSRDLQYAEQILTFLEFSTRR